MEGTVNYIMKTTQAEVVRVQKYLSDAGIMSRRAAEKAMNDGEIRINGEIASLGDKVTIGVDRVTYNGRPVSPIEKKVYIMLNKPVGYLTAMSDSRGRKCVSELVSDVGTRVYPAGRLDLESEGLLLLSNDGELVNRLTHPKHSVPKYYHVTVDCVLSEEQRKRLSSPMDIDGYVIRPVRHRVIKSENGNMTLEMQLFEGRNRQIRKMCERVGAKVLKLKRVAIGEIRLGALTCGKWKALTYEQVQYLKSKTGML